ncbi:hypothetical protein QHG78_11910 [Bacteroides sp. A1-P5]|uniref:Uncharacterized protein n=1 Tax=Bacteroides vicugnae TaxID=3037989 RepID=A0ABU5HN95_9BACE|nr:MULTISPECIES: hypothetical protein [unclassified Bacteroides]MDY7253976.1 hypothetical protein [Bacteroides sp. A1-P5]MDY7257078.1 hypothetical protein [Bacteroides sp. A2-P53]
METINLQDFITEKNVELQEFIKEQMRVHQLSNLSIDQRELMIDTPAISTKQMIDAYYSTIQHVTARLIELEGKNETSNKRQNIIMKKIAKKEKECKRIEKKARKQEKYSRKLTQEYNKKYNANIQL